MAIFGDFGGYLL